MAVVVQRLVAADAAGVLFTRDPLDPTGKMMRVEAAWGLGEAVVNGMVVPDRARLSRHGDVLEFLPGDKDIKVWYDEGDGTTEVSVDAALRQVPCITSAHLAALHDLAERCRRVWGPDLDIEWALGSDDTVFLLQCRPITTLHS